MRSIAGHRGRDVLGPAMGSLRVTAFSGTP